MKSKVSARLKWSLGLLALVALGCKSEEEQASAPVLSKAQRLAQALPEDEDDWPGVDFVVKNSAFVGAPDRSVSSDEERMFGFERLSDWSVYSGSGSLALNAAHKTQGAYSLELSGMGFLGARNVTPLTKDDGPPPEVIGVDVMPPVVQVNPNWQGDIQFYLDAPSAGIYSAYLGLRPFDTMPKGEFTHVEFVVPGYLMTQLEQSNYNDLRFVVAINVNSGSAPHYVDRLTFGPDPGPSGATLYGSLAATYESPGPVLTENAELTLGEDTRLVGNIWADTVHLRGGSAIDGDVQLNEQFGLGQILGQVDNGLSLPLPIGLPPVPTITPGAEDILLSAAEQRTLAPGSYGRVTLSDGAGGIKTVLTLNGGRYQFEEIAAGSASAIHCAAPCDIDVLGGIQLGQYTDLGPSVASGMAPAEVRLTTLANNAGSSEPSNKPSALTAGAGTSVRAYVHVPNGTARFARGSSFQGRIVAQDLVLGAGVSLEACAPSDLACDGSDDDCDGLIDEDYVALVTTCGVGACETTGLTSCVAGAVVDDCQPGTPLSNVDLTCDGDDDDCDGEVDEEYSPHATACGVGECANSGVTSCLDGVEQDSCVPEQPSASQDLTCDGKDDDCDGQTDEEFQGLATSCGVGACMSTGVTQCVGGAIADTCVASQPAADDAVCDGVDSDCDGQVDENYAALPTSCGVGACYSTGVTSCSGGAVADSCQIGAPSTGDATCDGIDDDCDGQVDEDYVAESTSCGVGACASAGTTSCEAGAVVDSCQAGQPATSDPTCDGVDDDCDGTADEDYSSIATSCGVGACQQQGSTSCQTGAVVDSCIPLEGDSLDLTCDGIDDDCDGQVDEEYAPILTQCGAGVCQETGLTSCESGQEVDSCEPGTAAADDATCDGLDNDCDGQVDEDFVVSSSTCGVGACSSTGTVTCVAGVLSDSCEPAPPGDSDAICDGLDNDCDGSVDEDYVAVSTACGVGACAATGITSCEQGSVVDSCASGSPASADATCDGVDDDCDGESDEDFVAEATSCGVGACAASGATACVNGEVQNSCSPGQAAAFDTTCDGVDDDCNGEVDEDYVVQTTSCGVGACENNGSTDCVAGVVVNSCVAGAPAASDATCDAIDDDCDGVADEDYSSLVTSCGIGACGETGASSCVNGQIEDSCVPGAPALIDSNCDGVDDDCDGEADEDYLPQTTSCGIGACSAVGATSCVAGAESDSCSPAPAALDDATCDGVDNDCDGNIDEDYLSSETQCGTGACQSTGLLRCENGSTFDTCEPLEGDAIDTTCDGVDDDCDGAIDEDYLPSATQCGVGVCIAEGETSCILGAEEDSCEPGSAAADDATCDGLDNDCDGQVDENYQSRNTVCGVGECSATGSTSCVLGQEQDDCAPGIPAASDVLCDGLDEDCDGLIDEEYLVSVSSCGQGACQSSGALMCEAGQTQDTCQPGQPASDDANCNGIDDDCDGLIDEDYVAQPISCGVGACAASGELVCAGGQLVQQCEPGEPAASDANCDSVDDDCDGEVDEDYVAQPTTCGLGACGRTGTTSCSVGVVLDSCVAGQPALADATCDGVDDDCDGTNDEDYQSLALQCGVGACQAAGQTECIAGQVVQQCSPLQPAPSDSTCDAIDDDCDGQSDEDYVALSTNCGVGQCASSGLTSCVGGQIQNSCQAGTPAVNDSTCDGLDDDCNGEADEDFVSTATQCGLGVCQASGSTSCQSGQVVDNCQPGPAAASDSTCDGLDEDCDGQVDEDFSPASVSCGVGLCVATGTTTCSSGSQGIDCTPLQPSVSTDTSCDGQDNDCDGAIDEDFVTETISCGVGACERSGSRSCDGGTLSESCSPALPVFESDSICDGVDEDCDGSVDEDFQQIPISCGVGQCAASGLRGCDAGALTNDCTPGTPASDDSSCNGLDDDCDGGVDEDFVPSCSGDQVQSCDSGNLVQVSCSDGDLCTGVESCLNASCVSGTPLDSDDHDPCTIDLCDPLGGVQHTPASLGTPCGGTATCDGQGTCVGLPSIIVEPVDQNIIPGQPFTLIVQATGSALTYQWFLDGSPLPGQTQPLLTVASATAAMNGTRYVAVVTNVSGSVSSREALILVGDSVGPVIELTSPAVLTTSSAQVEVTGIVTDNLAGVASVWLESAQLPGVPFQANLGPDGRFSSTVGLSAGINVLTVHALDALGNESTLDVVATLELQSTPQIEILSPLSGSLLSANLVDVMGVVRTSLLGSQLRIQLAGATFYPQGNSGEYDFAFENVHLVSGRNDLQITVVSPEGTVSRPLVLFFDVDEGSVVAGDPPVIALDGITGTVYETSDQHTVKGTVSAKPCVATVLVNGASTSISGVGEVVSFTSTWTVPDDGTAYPMEVSATDCLGRTTSVQYEVYFDGQAPTVSLSVPEAPTVNTVTETPFRISASIFEPNLAGVSLGSQSISVLPSGSNTWDFEVAVPLIAGVERNLPLVVWDHAGNRFETAVILALDGDLDIEWLSPTAGTKIETLSDPVEVSVSVRVPGMAAGDRVLARIDNLAASELTGTGPVRKGALSMPLAPGSHQVWAQVVTLSGERRVESSVGFSLVDASTIAPELTTILPARGAVKVEVNEPIELQFNRPLDSTKLEIIVTETGSAKIYAEAEAAADLLSLSDVQMVDVQKSNDAVDGSLSAILGDRTFVFYPQQDYLYTGTVSVTVRYEGAEVTRSSFQVRDVPTVLEGVVVDTTGSPAYGVSVTLDDGVRTVMTDRNGAFSFGAGSIDEAVEPGVHLLTLNGGYGNPRLGTLEYRVNLQYGRLTSIGVLSVPAFDASEPYRLIESGAVALLSGGAFSIDLTQAQVAFRDGASSGGIHAEPFLRSQFVPPVNGNVFVPFGYSMEPKGISVSGVGEVSFELPLLGARTDYRTLLGDWAILMGVEPASLALVPIGVATVDRVTRRATSQGPIHLELLDYVGLAFVPAASEGAVQRYAAGEISLNQLRASLAQ